MIGVLDCNNFFVSCERVFRPELKNKAVIVLSNNDGCAIARSNEAKALGVKMGEPFFKLKHWVDKGELIALSCNHVLYGDMSKRVMSIARRFVPFIEVYSIDECFLDLEGIADIKKFGEQLAQTIERWTGIPISIGIAQTKTLAKMASKFAKKHTGYNNCCIISTEEQRRKALHLTPIEDVWGIGRQLSLKCHNLGIHNALDLAQLPEQIAFKLFNKSGQQTWYELRGVPQITFQGESHKKSITCSRSFKEGIKDFATLSSLIADFASLAAHRLRKDNGKTKTITIFIATSRFLPPEEQYSNAIQARLDVATNDLRELINAGIEGLKKIYNPSFTYKKAGVTLTEIQYKAIEQNLFDTIDREKQERLLQAIDKIREKSGMGAIRVAIQNPIEHFVRKDLQSKHYTTNMEDIIIVHDLAPHKY